MSDRSTRESLRRLWRELGWPERRPLLRGFLWMTILGLATGAFAFLTGPLLRHLFSGGTAPFGLRVPAFLSAWTEEPARLRTVFPLLLLALAAVRGLAYLGQFRAMGWFGQRVAARLRRRLFVRLLGRSPIVHAQDQTGELLQRFGAEVGAIESAATYAVASYLRDGLQLVVLAAVAFVLDWRLALACGVVVPLVGLPAARLARSVVRNTRVSQARLGEVASELEESLRELPLVQVFGGEAAAEARLAKAAAAHRRAIVRAGWKRAGVPALTELVAAGALAGVLGWSLSRGVPGPALVSFVTTLALMYQPAKDIGRFGQLALQAAVAAERIRPLLDADDRVADVPGARGVPRLARGIELQDVSFGYGARAALQGLSLRIDAGKTTALVGRSGAGKSTVARLLQRAARPQGGRILIDGEDVDRFTVESLRAQLAWVTQEPLLFTGTIAENLRLGRPDASTAELERACRAAGAHEFIRALPNGYDTRLGERGGGLSGGQRQRLCLARALLLDAPLLVLDEATAGLDAESEREVQSALDGALPGRTALVIAHRLVTVAGADPDHVLEGGRVVEEGTHATLVARGGAYADLWRAQSASAPPPEAGAA